MFYPVVPKGPRGEFFFFFKKKKKKKKKKKQRKKELRSYIKSLLVLRDLGQTPGQLWPILFYTDSLSSASHQHSPAVLGFVLLNVSDMFRFGIKSRRFLVSEWEKVSCQDIMSLESS